MGGGGVGEGPKEGRERGAKKERVVEAGVGVGEELERVGDLGGLETGGGGEGERREEMEERDGVLKERVGEGGGWGEGGPGEGTREGVLGGEVERAREEGVGGE